MGYASRSDNKLKRIAIAGGAPVVICEFAPGPPGGFGPVWNPDNNIYLGQPKGIFRVAASGGALEEIITLKDDETAHHPQLLPGGDSLVFTLRTASRDEGWDNAQIVVQSIKSGERKVLIARGSDARYLPTGHIVYALGTSILAVSFDPGTVRVGNPVPIVDGVRRATAQAGGGADAK